MCPARTIFPYIEIPLKPDTFQYNYGDTISIFKLHFYICSHRAKVDTSKACARDFPCREVHNMSTIDTLLVNVTILYSVGIRIVIKACHERQISSIVVYLCYKKHSYLLGLIA